MMLKTLALGAALLTIALSQAGCKTAAERAASNPNEPTAAQIAAATDPTGEDPVICKRQADTASRVKKNKVCKTKSAWAQDEVNAKKFATDADRRGATQAGGEAINSGN
jgi:hypothetical protein